MKPTRKLRGDSHWSGLAAGQQEQLEDWLFEEKLGYRVTLARVREEFGLEVSVASVGRICRRLARERQAAEVVDSERTALDMKELGIGTGNMREAAVQLVAKEVLRVNSEEPEELDRFESLTRLLLECERNELRWTRTQLAERRFEMAAVAECQEDLARLKTYLGQLDKYNLTREHRVATLHVLLHGNLPHAEAMDGVRAAQMVLKAMQEPGAAGAAGSSAPAGETKAGDGIGKGEEAK
jgi:hypothetical protein